jgi:hypothetical protein
MNTGGAALSLVGEKAGALSEEAVTSGESMSDL